MHAQIAFSRFIHHLGSIRIKIRLTWHAFQPPSVTMFCFPLYLHVTSLRSVSTHFISVFNFALFIVGNIALYNICEFQFNKLLGLLVFPYSKSLNNPLKKTKKPQQTKKPKQAQQNQQQQQNLIQPNIKLCHWERKSKYSPFWMPKMRLVGFLIPE